MPIGYLYAECCLERLALFIAKMATRLGFLMPFITQEMIDAATAESSNAHSAGIIQSLGGLGGCRTMDQAPPEIAKWFNRECSSAEIIFGAMDPLCTTPYGQKPSAAMVEAGNLVLDRLITVKFAEPVVRADMELMSEIPDYLKPYMFSDETCSAHVYRRMRAVADEEKTETAD